MSIVNDALKKIEKKRDSANLKTPPQKIEEKRGEQPPVQMPITPPKVSPQKKKKKFYLLKIIIFLGIVLTSAFFIKLFSDRSGNPISPRNPMDPVSPISSDTVGSRSERVTPFGQIVETTIPLTGGAKFELTGIMFSEDNPVAIINNEIVSEGDTIEGAVVDSIQESRVELSYSGQDLILKVK